MNVPIEYFHILSTGTLPLLITKDVSPTGTHSVRIVASSGVEDTVPYVISDTPGVQLTTCILLVARMVLVHSI